jgi:hypothetical protein
MAKSLSTTSNKQKKTRLKDGSLYASSKTDAESGGIDEVFRSLAFGLLYHILVRNGELSNQKMQAGETLHFKS